MLPGKTLTIHDFFAMAKRHVWLLVVPPLVTFFAALVFSSRVPSLYQSDMLISIDPQRIPDSYVRPTVTLPMDLRVDALTVQALSRTALEAIINDLNLYPKQRQTQPLEDVVREMRSRVQVTIERPREPQWGGNNSPTAFHVMFTYPDPKLAQEVAQRIGLRYVEQNTRERGDLATAANRFLEARLNEARQGLERQERLLEAFRERHGKELPTQMQSNMQALTNAQMQVQSLVESVARDRDRKLMLERLYREASLEPPTPVATVPTVRQPERPTTTQQQLIDARAALANVEQRYRPDHPDVSRARRLVTDLEAKVASEAALTPPQTPSAPAAPTDPLAGADPQRRENLRQMRAEIESLDRQIAFRESEEQRVRNEILDYQRRVEAVPGLESEWMKLTRDYDTQQAAYKDLLAKSTQAQTAADLEQEDIGERFRIVDPANVPVRPLPSMRPTYNLGGLAIGLFFGLALAGLIEFRDRSFRSEADVVEVLALPVLASVPYVATASEIKRARQRRLAFSALGVCSLVIAAYVTWSLKLWNSLV